VLRRNLQGFVRGFQGGFNGKPLPWGERMGGGKVNNISGVEKRGVTSLVLEAGRGIAGEQL